MQGYERRNKNMKSYTMLSYLNWHRGIENVRVETELADSYKRGLDYCGFVLLDEKEYKI